VIRLDATAIRELEEQRPATPAGLLSRQEKERLIERALVALYRWYLARSQRTRNWNPDYSFDWRAFRTDHSPAVNTMLEGYYGVEQYIPDYVTKLVSLVRKSYGRAQFQIRWGSEEEKHTDAWLNTILFSRFRSLEWIEAYQEALRSREMYRRWDDVLHMLFYTLIQERATQITYLHTAAIAGGKSDKVEFATDVDPVLEAVCRTIAIDEAAHYNFFIEVSRLMFYYFPSQSLEALVDVIKAFAMPAGDLIPDFDHFEEVVAKAAVFGPRQYASDVLQTVLKNLSLQGARAFSAGVRQSRSVPDPDGNLVSGALFDVLDYEALEAAVRRAYGRLSDYEREVGYQEVQPLRFVSSGLSAVGV
jgi:acyl-[acyl-carrier-protein] desaturase